MNARTGPIFSCCAVLIASLWAGAAARADDFGPPHDVASIRNDAKTLLAAIARQGGSAPDLITVSDVVVVGDEALYSFRAGVTGGTIALLRTRGQWWIRLRAFASSYATVVDAQPPLRQTLPDADGIGPAFLRKTGLSAALVQAAAQHNPSLSQSVPHNAVNINACCSKTMQRTVAKTGGTVIAPAEATDGFLTTIAYAPNNGSAGTSFDRIIGRAPTEAESTQMPHGDAFYYFDFSFTSSAPVTFNNGTRIDVWFPYVLDTRLRYSLTVGFADKPIGPIDGTIHDNTLSFTLPGFTVNPGVMLMAEIDGD
ncbi:MAG: hypothetical protein ACXVAM_11935 [Vulcanimicrobiaceae bacterium]